VSARRQTVANKINPMPIQLAFQDENLRKVCESTISAKRKYGSFVGPSLHARLADLKAADSPADLVDLGFAEFAKPSNEKIVIFLDDGYRILISANHKPLPRTLGQLDWKQVTRVKILSIERANEN
jgi:plasmid maintenance system killer protein